MPMSSCITFFSDKIMPSCIKTCQKMEALGIMITGTAVFMSSGFMPRESWGSAALAFTIMGIGLLVMVAGINSFLRSSGNRNNQEDAESAILSQP